MAGKGLTVSAVGWMLYVPYLLTISKASLGWPWTESDDGVLFTFKKITSALIMCGGFAVFKRNIFL